MIEIHLTKEAQLGCGALVLFCLAIVLSILGERTLPLFGGDYDLAGRFYKTFYAILWGCIAGFSAPIAVVSFISKLRIVLATNGGDSRIAQLLLRDDILRFAQIIGFTLMVVFVLSGFIVACIIWINGN